VRRIAELSFCASPVWINWGEQPFSTCPSGRMATARNRGVRQPTLADSLGINGYVRLDSLPYYVRRYYAVRNNMSDPTLLVLASLADGDKHGYAMMDDIQAFAGVRLGPGTLYGAITRLEERGWIQALNSTDRRRPYRLTAAGRRHLQEALAGLDQLVKAGQRRLKPV